MWWLDLVPSTTTHATSVSATQYKNFPWPFRSIDLTMCTRQDHALLQTWNLSTLNRMWSLCYLRPPKAHYLHWAKPFFWKANIFLANEEFFHLLWNQKAHYCVYELLPVVHILNLINQVHTLSSCFKMNFNTSISFSFTPGSAEQSLSFWSLTKTIHAYSRCASYLFD